MASKIAKLNFLRLFVAMIVWQSPSGFVSAASPLRVIATRAHNSNIAVVLGGTFQGQPGAHGTMRLLFFVFRSCSFLLGARGVNGFVGAHGHNAMGCGMNGGSGSRGSDGQMGSPGRNMLMDFFFSKKRLLLQACLAWLVVLAPLEIVIQTWLTTVVTLFVAVLLESYDGQSILMHGSYDGNLMVGLTGRVLIDAKGGDGYETYVFFLRFFLRFFYFVVLVVMVVVVVMVCNGTCFCILTCVVGGDGGAGGHGGHGGRGTFLKTNKT